MMGKILVTGVTGNVGSEVARRLIGVGFKVKAAVRNIEKAKKLLGEMEYVRFVFGEKDTYDEALEGASKVFLVRPPEISDAEKLIKPFIEKAKDKGVEQIVFLSLMGIEHNPVPPHYKIEKYIKESGIPYTFLRPSFFMQNLNTAHCYDIKERNDIFIPAGKAKVSFIDVRDIGEAGANAFMDDVHKNKEYTLTGCEALDYYQAADIFSDVLKRKITYSNPSPIKFRNVMIERGINRKYANVMMSLYITTRLGMAKKVTSELENLLGRKPVSLEQYVNDYADYWR